MLALSVKTIKKKKTAAEAQNPNAFAAGVESWVCKKMNARMCVVTQDEHCLCEWRWVMAKAALGRIAGLSHFSGGRSGADKLTPPPPPRAGVEEEDEIRACFPMLLPRQEPAGGRL